MTPVRQGLIALFSRTGGLDEAVRLRNQLRRRAYAIRRRALLAVRRPFLRNVRHDPPTVLTVWASGGVSPTAVLARRRSDPSVLAAIESNERLATTILDDAGISYRRLPSSSDNRRRVAVLADDRDRVLRALRHSAPVTCYVYLDDTSIPRRRRLVHVSTTHRWRHATAADVWRVLEFQADDRGRDVLGDIHGCEIEFWQSGGTDEEVVASRWNSRVTTLPRARFTGGPDDERPLVTDIQFPVDLVYTWVDGDDPAWQRRRDETLGRSISSTHHREAASAARYTSYDELRFSLRSVERYADFVRHVYVVTDGQRPHWMVDHHPRLTIVDHRAIFDDHETCLPTFNSHAIESRLHHVPGLSEHYVYMNDDFVFGRRVTAETFFLGNGLARYFPSRALVPPGGIGEHTKPVDAAAINGRELVGREFGRLVTRKMQHAPYPQLRSVHLEIERRFPREVARTAASRVRSPVDLSMASFLHHHVAFLLGRAVPGRLQNRYVDLSDPNLDGRLEALVRHRNYDSLCINDTDSTSVTAQEKRRIVTAFFDECFPEASTFER